MMIFSPAILQYGLGSTVLVVAIIIAAAYVEAMVYNANEEDGMSNDSVPQAAYIVVLGVCVGFVLYILGYYGFAAASFMQCFCVMIVAGMIMPVYLIFKTEHLKLFVQAILSIFSCFSSDLISVQE